MYKAFILIFFFTPISVLAMSTTSITTIRQGDVAFIEIKKDCHKTSLSIPKLGTFPVLNFQNKKLLTIPTDISQATGTYILPKCGTLTEGAQKFFITSREKEVQEFVIPKEQGGNTTDNAVKVKKNIQNDSRVLKVFTNKKQLWSNPFIFPIENYVITDTYGYTRDSKGINIIHKGIDFRAETGTPIHAMNRGVVRYVGTLPAYGKTIIIDHGRGAQTVYLHLSKILVKEGSLVKQNKIIGESGKTGFVTGAHLHVSVRVLGISVDPESFMNVVGEK